MKRVHWKIFSLAFFIIIAGTMTLLIVKGKNMPEILRPDLNKHPIYSKYEFNNTDKTIYAGVQPLYFPTSLITEVMKRDLILKEELKTLGLEIRFYNYLKGDDINFFIRTGNLDIGVGGDMPAITAAATLDIIVLSLIQQGYVSIVANKQMLISNLRGKRVGYAFGSNAHYALLTTLKSYGINETQAKLISMEVTKMPESLNKGEITAFSAWEPTPSIALKLNKNSTIIHQRLSLGFIYCRNKLYKEHPEAVYQLMAAELRAISWMQAKRHNLLLACQWAVDECQEAFGTKLNLSINDIASIAEKDLLGQTTIPAVSEQDLESTGPLHQELIFLKDIKKIPDSTSWPRVRAKFRTEILNYVRANKKKFRTDKQNYENTHDTL